MNWIKASEMTPHEGEYINVVNMNADNRSSEEALFVNGKFYLKSDEREKPQPVDVTHWYRVRLPAADESNVLKQEHIKLIEVAERALNARPNSKEEVTDLLDSMLKSVKTIHEVTVKERTRNLTENELMHSVICGLSDTLCFAFELKSPEGKALAFTIDSAIKLAQVIERGDCPLRAAADYTAYEEEVYVRNIRNGKPNVAN